VVNLYTARFNFQKLIIFPMRRAFVRKVIVTVNTDLFYLCHKSFCLSMEATLFSETNKIFKYNAKLLQVFKGLNQATTSSFHVRSTSLFTIIQSFDAESMHQNLLHIVRLTGNCLPVYRVWLFTSHSSVCMLLLTKYGERLCAGFIGTNDVPTRTQKQAFEIN